MNNPNTDVNPATRELYNWLAFGVAFFLGWTLPEQFAFQDRLAVIDRWPNHLRMPAWILLMVCSVVLAAMLAVSVVFDFFRYRWYDVAVVLAIIAILWPVWLYMLITS